MNDVLYEWLKEQDNWRREMRLARNLSLALLVTVLIVVKGGKNAQATTECGWYGPDPAVYSSVETPSDCSILGGICTVLENTDGCRTLCLEYCQVATEWSFQYCDLTPAGGSDCTMDAMCICDTDVRR